MLSAGGADAAKAVGAWGRYTQHAQRQAGQQQSLRHRVRRTTQTDGVLPARRSCGHAGLARQDQGEWPGPKSGHQGLCKLGHLSCKQRHLVPAGHMHDQRMFGRASLGRKDFCHGRVVGRIGGQAVNGLGGQTDQLAVTQSQCSLRNGSRGGTQDHGGH